jgi:hypothetical protein
MDVRTSRLSISFGLKKQMGKIGTGLDIDVCLILL